jgi:hypothetical protein
MPGDNIPESMGEDISEQAGAIISESVGGFPRNQQSNGMVVRVGVDVDQAALGRVLAALKSA